MKWRTAIAAVTAASLIGPAGTLASTKKKPAKQPPQLPASSMEPARMIEIRPGYFISSYSCVTDQGYGRVLPCSYSGDKN